MAVQSVQSRTRRAGHAGPALLHSRRWLDDHGLEARLYPSGGLDGLATAALLSRRAGGEVSFVNPFAGPLDTTAAAIIIDRGVAPVLTRAPVLYVDHHHNPASVNGTVLWDDSVTAAAALAWRLVGSPDDAGWLVGLGILGDRGPAELADSRLPLGPTEPLVRLAELCRAACALSSGPLTAAFTVLRRSQSARSALEHPQAGVLARAREQYERRLREAAATAPRVGPQAAVLEIDVPARVEAQLAGAWARRLAPCPVVVLNRGSNPRHIDVAAAGLEGLAPKPAARLRTLVSVAAPAGPEPAAAEDRLVGTLAASSAAGLIRTLLAPAAR